MSQNKNNSYQFVVFLLSISLLVLLFKNYKDNKTSNELQNSLKNDSAIVQNQLSEMLVQYDSVLSVYNNLDDNLAEVSDIKNSEITNEYNIKNINPKNIKLVNKKISVIKDSIKSLKLKLTQLEKIKAKNSTLSKVILANNNQNENSALEVTNLQAKGVKFLNDENNTKNKNIEQLRVCFTVDKSKNVLRGDKELFIQIVNPKNEIVSKDKLSFEKNNKILRYSKAANFYYAQNITDVCDYVDLEKTKTIKGRYIINLYSGTKKIGTTIFNYN